MSTLAEIKRHVDSHGVGCVIVNDHVAISVLWRSKNFGGEERIRETTERVRSFEESCGVLGCACRLCGGGAA